MRPEKLRAGQLTHSRVGQIYDDFEELSKVTSMTATYPIILDQTWCGWVISFDVTALLSEPLTFTGPVTFENTVNFLELTTFETNVVFTGAYTVTVVNAYTFNFGTSVSLSVAPPGVFLPPYISVNYAPTYTPVVGTFPWVQTNTGMYWWNGSAWVIQGFPHIGARVYNTSAVTMTYDVERSIPFISEDYDDATFHDNATNNTRLTIPLTGRYHVGGCAGLKDAALNKSLKLSIRLNGTAYLCHSTSGEVTEEEAYASPHTDWQFTAGDYVELMGTLWTADASNMDLNTTEADPAFWIHRIG